MRNRIDTLKNNPIFTRLIKHHLLPDQLIWLLFGTLAAGGLVVTLLLFIFDPYGSRPGPVIMAVLITFGSLGLALISAPLAGLISAIATIRDTRSEMYELVKVTNLAPRDMVIGYLLAALYRLRLLWALTFGVLPPLFVSTWHALVMMDYSFSGWDCYECETPPLREYLVDNIDSALLIVGIGAVLGIILNWLAICSALRLALWRKQLGVSIGGMLVNLGLAMGLFILCFVVFASLPDLLQAIGSLIVGVFCVLLGFGWLRFAARKL